MFRLLCVTAHPDDEAGGFGGSLLLYRERGVETHVICLTPGQAATHRGTTRSNQELAEARRREFADSCRILRVSRAEVLNYEDGSLDRSDFYTVTAELVARIREIRPQVVMTFGSEGAITAHPDHSMAGMFTTMAFQWAGRSNRFPDQVQKGLRPYRPQKLYYATASFTLPDRQPVAMAPPSAIIEIGEYFGRKVEAFKAHTTQAPLVPVFENAIRQRGHQELFHLAATVNLKQIEVEKDLFAGVVED